MISNPARFRHALDTAIARFGATSGTIHVCEGRRRALRLVASRNLPASMVEIVNEIAWGKGLAGRAAERATPICHDNLQVAPSTDIHTRARSAGVSGAIIVPMLRDTDVVGTIGIGTREPREFSNEDVEWLLDLGREIALEIEENREAA